MTRLDEAMRSLREDVDGESADAPQTLARILQARRVKPSRTRIRLVALLAATFLLLGSVAWAAFSRREHERQRPAPVTEPPSLPIAGPVRPSSPAPEAVVLSARLPEPEVPPLAAPVGGPPPSASPSLPKSEQASGELAAYEKGHRAQFEDRNSALAVSLWDEFLRRYPKSRWEPDVRYNRALCLIRLHRTEEARQALEPFARGYGGYRQSEAVALLAALGDAAP